MANAVKWWHKLVALRVKHGETSICMCDEIKIKRSPDNYFSSFM